MRDVDIAHQVILKAPQISTNIPIHILMARLKTKARDASEGEEMLVTSRNAGELFSGFDGRLRF